MRRKVSAAFAFWRLPRYGGMMRIQTVSRLDLPLKPFQWAFAQERRDEIAAHFEKVRLQKPAVWNGRILLCRNPRIEDDCFHADYFETDFASFLAWRDFGFPDKDVFNAFGMSAPHTNDGAFILGRMGDQTANAGRVYFPAGTPDPHDIADGHVDLVASIVREVEEEIGLKAGEFDLAEGWTIVSVRQAIACYRVLNIRLTAEPLCLRIAGYLAGQREPELSAVMQVRSSEDFSLQMPDFVTAFLERAFAR